MSDVKEIRLQVRISEKEFEQIQNNAKAMDKSVSAFIRATAENFCILKCDYKQITDHTHEITSLRNAINQLVYTIKKTGEYVPADLEFILMKMNEISKSENEFIDLMLDDKEKKTKAIIREVRKIVRQKLSKDTKI